MDIFWNYTIYPTHCVINVTFFIPFWSPETTILLVCTKKSRLLSPLATPIFEQEQSACSAIIILQPIRVVRLHDKSVSWTSSVGRGLHFLKQTKRIVASGDENALINVYKHQSKSYSSFNYNKDSILLLVTFQIHCLLKNKNLFEGVGEPPSNSTFSAPCFPTAQQGKPFVEKGYDAVIHFFG